MQIFCIASAFERKKGDPLKGSAKLYLCISVLALATVLLAAYSLTKLGILTPWSGRFYSLWDINYAVINIPIIISVSEHQPTPWQSVFFDLNVLMCFYPAGIWLCFKHLDDARIFLILYAITASYFSGIMVRLILALAPVVCIASAICFSTLLNYEPGGPVGILEAGGTRGSLETGDKGGTKDSWETEGSGETEESMRVQLGRERELGVEQDSQQPMIDSAGDSCHDAANTATQRRHASGTVYNYFSAIICGIVLVFFALHSVYATSLSYSNPSVIMSSELPNGTKIIIDDFR